MRGDLIGAMLLGLERRIGLAKRRDAEDVLGRAVVMYRHVAGTSHMLRELKSARQVAGIERFVNVVGIVGELLRHLALLGAHHGPSEEHGSH